jgi:hypothetical protein
MVIREQLRAANSDPLRIARRDPHRGVGRDPKATPGKDDFELKGPWCVEAQVPANCAGVLRDDVTDFLRRMEVTVSETGAHSIRLSLHKDLPPRGFRLDLRPDAIGIEGGDAAGLWAGVAWWERQMRVRRGPILPRGKIERQAPWSTQISQGPWGGNYSVPNFSPEYLSDDAFRLYAHYGVNSMMIYGDYSIDYTGPSPEIQQLAVFAHETGRPLFVKSETGIGLEVFQFPYVPAMQHLARKWQGVRSLKPQGVHQAWLFFGMAGTRAEELGLWAAYEPHRPVEHFLREKIAWLDRFLAKTTVP